MKVSNLIATGKVKCLTCNKTLLYGEYVDSQNCLCGNISVHGNSLYDNNEQHLYEVKPSFYEKVGKKTILVDLDKTLAANAYPLIGKPNQKLIDHLIKKMSDYNVVVFTCRLNPDIVGGPQEVEWHREQIRNWLDDQGLNKVSISKHVKPYGIIYWDDKSVNPRNNQVMEFIE